MDRRTSGRVNQVRFALFVSPAEAFAQGGSLCLNGGFSKQGREQDRWKAY